jgi:O-antigen/teichoic acid export membrane protein
VRLDILLLAVLRTPMEVGLYDLPAKLYELLVMAPYLFGGLLMPLFVRDLEGPTRTPGPRLQAALGLVLLFDLFALAAFLVHAEQIAVLFGGEQFSASGMPLRILGVAAVFGGAGAIMRYAATALNRGRQMMHVDLISLIVAAIVHAVFIPRYGVIGAAFGKLAGDVVRVVLGLRLLRDHLPRAAWRITAIACVVAAALAAALWLLRSFEVHWMIATALCGLVAMGACYALPPVRRTLAVISAH